MSPHEQIALLVVLVDDQDPEISSQADATISRLPRQALADYLASDVPAELRAFFTSRAAAATSDPAPAIGSGAFAESLPNGDGATIADDPSGRGETAEGEGGDDEEVESKLVSTLPIADRLKLATKGTREQRAQLIRDSNRIVATAVLTSPKLTESEVEAFAKMGNVSEDVLRIIGTHRAWLKNYSIVHAVTRNPKTPPAISMQLMHRLSEKDIKMLSTDRNVPEALRLSARRVLTKATNK